MKVPVAAACLVVGGLMLLDTPAQPAGLLAGAPSNAIELEEVSGQPQSRRPVTIGRVFARGEIANYAQARVHNVPVETQCDVKTRWPDGSVQHAVLTFFAGLPRNRKVAVDFVNQPSGHNDGGLTRDEMLAFAGTAPGTAPGTAQRPGWNAALSLTAGGRTKTIQARDMLASLPMDDAHIRYWLRGSLVTQVIVEDRSPERSQDAGWHWDGQAMTETAEERFRSLHPIYILTFYRGWPGVQVEFILENTWTDRIQDQVYSLRLTTGAGLETLAYEREAKIFSARDQSLVSFESSPGQVTVKTKGPHGLKPGDQLQITGMEPAAANRTVRIREVPRPDEFRFPMSAGGRVTQGGPSLQSFTHFARTRWRKTFWSGTAPKPIRVNHNLRYMIFSRLLPSYDTSLKPDTGHERNGAPDSGQPFPGGFDSTDRGDIMGSANFIKSFSANEEGGILQRQEVLLAYTWNEDMYEVMFGTSVPGGGGVSAVPAHIPIHWREGRNDGKKFCLLSCSLPHAGVPNFGRVFSTDAWPRQQTLNYTATPPVGFVHPGHGWSPDVAHVQDHSFLPYIITGSYYFLEELQYWAAWTTNAVNPNGSAYWNSNGPWGYVAVSTQPRQHAWGLRMLGHAAFASVDGSPEKQLFTAKVDNNIAIMEGYYDLRDGSFPPADAECAGYNRNVTKDRWCWGKYTVGGPVDAGPTERTHLDNPLLFPSQGLAHAGMQFVDHSLTYANQAPWMYSFMYAAYAHLEELGFERIRPLRRKVGEFAVNRYLNPDYNPYLADLYEMPVRKQRHMGARNPFFQSWAEVRQATPTTYNLVSYTAPKGQPCEITISASKDLANPVSRILDAGDSASRAVSIYGGLTPDTAHSYRVECAEREVARGNFTSTALRDKKAWTYGTASAENGYAFTSLAVASLLGDVTAGNLQGSAAYERLRASIEPYLGRLRDNPKWAITPRRDPLLITAASPVQGGLQVSYTAPSPAVCTLEVSAQSDFRKTLTTMKDQGGEPRRALTVPASTMAPYLRLTCASDPYNRRGVALRCEKNACVPLPSADAP